MPEMNTATPLFIIQRIAEIGEVAHRLKAQPIEQIAEGFRLMRQSNPKIFDHLGLWLTLSANKGPDTA